LKENQKLLYEQVSEYFQWMDEGKEFDDPVDHWESDWDKDHGRIEKREVWFCPTVDFIYNRKEWKHIRSVIRVRSYRSVGKDETGKWKDPTVTDRYYISSLNTTAKKIAAKIRSHWSIENSLHWVLDVVFGEDASKKRKGHTPEIFNVFKKMAIAVIKQHEVNRKKSYHVLMTRALLSDDYRKALLFQK
jgi:predicted transposase YbfD/YdcC